MTFFHGIFETSDCVDPRQRRRIRLLSAFLLLMALNYLVGALAMRAAGNGNWKVMLASSGALVISYILNRTRFYWSATVLAVIIPVVPFLASIIHSSNPAQIPAMLPWLCLPLLVCSLLLSIRQTIVVALSYVIVIFLVTPLAVGPTSILTQSLAVVLMLFFLVVASAATRHYDLAESEYQVARLRQAEHSLRESEEKYRAVFDQALDSIALIGLDSGEMLDFNRRTYEDLGYTCEEFAGLNLKDIDASPNPDEIKIKRDELLREGSNSFETRHRTKSGELRDVSINSSLINVGGQPVTLNIWHDITARKRAEHALRESEAKYHAVFDQAVDAIVLIDPYEGKILEFNRSAHESLGYTREEFAGINLRDIDVNFDITKDSKIAGQILTEGSIQFETRHRTKYGVLRDVSINARAIDIGGKTVAINIWHDITELKQAEEVLQTRLEYQKTISTISSKFVGLIENIDDAIDRSLADLGELSRADRTYLFLCNEDRVTMDNTHEWCADGVSSQITNLKGLPLEVFPWWLEELRSNRAIHIPDVSVMPLAATAEKEILESQGVKSVLVFPVNIRGELAGFIGFDNVAGNRVWSDDNFAILRVAAEIIGNSLERRRSDVKMRRTLADLERSNIKLAALNNELEAFSYSVSHDLRTPLRSIDGFSQALLEDEMDKLDEQGCDYLRRIRAASQRMGALIDDLLKLSRLSRTEMKLESVDLSALAEEVAAGLRQTEPERQVEFVIHGGMTDTGDRQLLRAALDNLIGNAWKFTGKRPQARIEVGVSDKEENTYFVKDNGAGFDMAYADKLFGAFQRLHDTAEFPGTGIGLATVQRIIHRHGGRIWAEGIPGAGATFYFHLG